MPLTRFKLSAIEDGGIATADLADGSVTTAKIADSAVTSGKTSNLFTNTEISGTEAARMPVGTTAQRANAQGGDIRFNTTLSLMEYYTGIEWKSIDSPPTVTNVSPSTIVDGTTVTVTGSNFQTGINISIIGSDGTTYTPDSIVRTNNTTATFDATAAMISGSLDYFDVRITNASNLSATLENALEITSTHTWATAAGSLGTIYDAGRSGHTFNAGTTYSGGESDVTVTHSISSGTLPSGLSINASTGVITGSTSAVGSDTTTNITVQYSAADASAGTTVTGTRNFSITQKAPTISTYTSTGSGTFSVPTGVSAVDVLVVAGAGGGGARGGGGGGAGGLIYRPAFPVTPGSTISTQVGTGGRRATMNNGTDSEGAVNGIDSIFGTLRAKGGGHGGNQTGSPVGPTPNGGAGTGGSGGGSHQNVYYNNNFANPMPNNATQPSQPGDSGSYGFGNQGGSNSSPSQDSYGALAGGGGGAGQAGTPGGTGDATMGKGGIGKQYDISGSQVYYAGGGGAGHHPGFPSQHSYSAGGNGGGGNGGSFPGQGAGGSSGQDGTSNRGGGGGGCTTDGNSGVHYGGTGGTGVIIVKY